MPPAYAFFAPCQHGASAASGGNLIPTGCLSVVELSGLPALTGLNLNKNKLTRLPRLPGAKKLEQVWLDHNQIHSLAGLETLQAKEMFIEHNKLTSLGLAPGGAAERTLSSAAGPPLPRILSLGVAHNQLTSIAGIERLVNLRYLYLEHNLLTTLDGFEKLKKLGKLHVSHNKLSTFAPLASAKLEELGATNNKVTAAPELFGKNGRSRPPFQRYTFRGNPIVGVEWILLARGMPKPLHRGYYLPAPSAGGGSAHGGVLSSKGSSSGRTRTRSIRHTSSRYSSSGGYSSGK